MTNLAVVRETEQAEKKQVNELVVVASQQPGVGQRLLSARKAKGWSKAQVARRLNLTETYVQALESDAFDRLPGPTFVKGYIKNYAACVGLSPQEILGVYERQAQPVSEQGNVRRRGKLKVASTDPVMRALGVLSVVLFVVSSMYWWQKQAGGLETVAEAVTVVEVETVSGETRVEKLDLSVQPEESAAAVANSQAPVAVDSMQVTFVDSSWLEVRDASGSVLFSGVKETGETLSLTSSSYFDVVIGNAAAVKLSYNSAPVDLTPYMGEGNEARFQLGL
jgi:cytoskeleton protein RodZ